MKGEEEYKHIHAINTMNTCRFCNASFTSRQARWKHEKFRCLCGRLPANEIVKVDKRSGMRSGSLIDDVVRPVVSVQRAASSNEELKRALRENLITRIKMLNSILRMIQN